MSKIGSPEKQPWYKSIEATAMCGCFIFFIGGCWFVVDSITVHQVKDIGTLLRLFGPPVVSAWLGRKVFLLGDSGR